MKQYRVTYFHPGYDHKRILIADDKPYASDGYTTFYSNGEGWIIPNSWMREIEEIEAN